VGSCGRPYTIVEVDVFDERDRPLPPGERGEIVCRGPQTMACYWNRPEATAEAFRGGWLHTGDIGYMDEDGFFYLVDRKNDMLISGGYNVYPREVEDVLLACEGVVEAAVVGLPDETWGERVYAVVAGRKSLTAEAVMAHARETLASYKRPGVEIWPELPKTSANKMRLVGLVERVLERMCRRAERRVAFGKALAEQTVTLERVANARILIEQTRLLTLKAAYMMDTVGNKAARQEIAMIKVASPAMAQQVIDSPMQLFAGGGMNNDHFLAAALATARLLRLADGPDEVHRNQIGRLELRRHRNIDPARTGGSGEEQALEEAEAWPKGGLWPSPYPRPSL